MTDSSLPPSAPGAPSDRAEGARDDDVGPLRRAQDTSDASRASVTGTPPPAMDHAKTRGGVGLRLAAVFMLALVMIGFGYLWIAVPGKWFSSARPLAWPAHELQVTRGVGRVVGDELHVTPNDPSGIVLVSIRTHFSSLDQASVAWIAIDVPIDAQASLLWRNDYKPDALNTLTLSAITGRLLPATLTDHPAWIGRIHGLALALRGSIVEPVRIRGVTVHPDDAPEIARQRVREWFAFEGWTGTSINAITGGADLQDLPLPLLLACTIALAALMAAALRWWRPELVSMGVLGSLAVFAFAGWLLLDMRWTWNLARQVEITAHDFAFKSFDDKRLAVEDGPLYEFIGKAREVMPKAPARVFVVADSHYYRGRAAYHLLPHRAYFDPRANTIPAPELMRPGDWLVVYQRKGIQFDASQGKLRWNNLQPVSADLKLASRGAAVFQVR